MNWSDLRLFLAVARGHGLVAAARMTGVSPPTLSRRMTAFERNFGQKLFDRRPQGYALTPAGRELLDKAQDVEQAVTAIDRWRDGKAADRAVRISAGTWTSAYFARNFHALCRDGDGFRIEFVTSDARVDIGRRAADIGIRNRRPEEQRLARQKIGSVAFAAYAGDRNPGQNRGWIAIGDGAAATPSARWVDGQAPDAIAIRTSSPRTALDLAKAGAGIAVLPCFIGDREVGLSRTTDLIAPLRHDQWLATHHDDRTHPAVRTVVRRIVRLVARDADLFRGAAPPSESR